MTALPPRKRTLRRRSEVRDLQQPIEVALNRLPGVWAAINRNGSGFYRNGDPCTFGLGVGSPDIVGGVSCRPVDVTPTVARLFWLEVKWPGIAPDPHQRQWMALHRARVPGVFVATVHSVEEAVAAVERCRKGEMQ